MTLTRKHCNLPNKMIWWQITIHSFFISIRVNWVEAQYAQDFSNLSLKLCLMVCLISNSFHGLILRLTWTLQWSILNVRIWTFNWVWHEHCHVNSVWHEQMFDMNTERNLVSSLILMFVRICLCNTILYTWFGKKWKWLKKPLRLENMLSICLFFKHLS